MFQQCTWRLATVTHASSFCPVKAHPTPEVAVMQQCYFVSPTMPRIFLFDNAHYNKKMGQYTLVQPNEKRSSCDKVSVPPAVHQDESFEFKLCGTAAQKLFVLSTFKSLFTFLSFVLFFFDFIDHCCSQS